MAIYKIKFNDSDDEKSLTKEEIIEEIENCNNLISNYNQSIKSFNEMIENNTFQISYLNSKIISLINLLKNNNF